MDEPLMKEDEGGLGRGWFVGVGIQVWLKPQGYSGRGRSRGRPRPRAVCAGGAVVVQGGVRGLLGGRRCRELVDVKALRMALGVFSSVSCWYAGKPHLHHAAVQMPSGGRNGGPLPRIPKNCPLLRWGQGMETGFNRALSVVCTHP